MDSAMIYKQREYILKEVLTKLGLTLSESIQRFEQQAFTTTIGFNYISTIWKLVDKKLNMIVAIQTKTINERTYTIESSWNEDWLKEIEKGVQN